MNERLEKLSLAATRWIGTTSSLIVHTAFFVVTLSLPWFGVDIDKMLLILTTVVSLEAIYLAIFIQMTVNRHAEHLQEVEENIEDIADDVEDISEEVEGIGEEVEELSDDVDAIQEELEVEDDDAQHEAKTHAALQKIDSALQLLISKKTRLNATSAARKAARTSRSAFVKLTDAMHLTGRKRRGK